MAGNKVRKSASYPEAGTSGLPGVGTSGVARVRTPALPENGRARELKRFLRAMRARLDPLDLGLATPARRRRIPGLRADEAAELAGVGLTWYAALEAGKDVRVSAKLLDRVVAALRLSPEERDHLFALARPREYHSAQRGREATLRPVIDGFTVGPAFVCDRFWNVHESNEQADRVYGHDRASEKNLLARMLFEPAFRALHDDWESVARQMVGIMQLSFGQTPDDAAGIAVIERLSAASEQFATWWNDYRLRRYEPSVGVIVHPVLGRLTLLFTSFIASSMAQRDDYMMIVMQSPLDEATRERLRAEGDSR
jgi:transcriptional regulator with XRE-family HTH domain